MFHLSFDPRLIWIYFFFVAVSVYVPLRYFWKVPSLVTCTWVYFLLSAMRPISPWYDRGFITERHIWEALRYEQTIAWVLVLCVPMFCYEVFKVKR